MRIDRLAKRIVSLGLTLLSAAALGQSREGIVWSASSDAFIRRDAEAFRRTLVADGVRVDQLMTSETDFKTFLLGVDSALSRITENSGELFIYLGSHGCIGSMFCNYERVSHERFLKNLLEKIHKFEATTHTKISLNLICDMCFSGSWMESLDPVLKSHPIKMNLLTSTPRLLMGYGNLFPAQFTRAEEFLKKMGSDARKFCPSCTDFERKAKLVADLNFSDILYPEFHSFPQAKVTTESDLLLMLKHADEKTLGGTVAFARQHYNFLAGREGEAFRNQLRTMANDSQSPLQLRAALELAEIEENPKQMLDVVTSPKFYETFKFRPYPNEVAFHTQIENQAEIVRSGLLHNFSVTGQWYDDLAFEPRTVEFFAPQMNRFIERISLARMNRLPELFEAIENYISSNPSTEKLEELKASLGELKSTDLKILKQMKAFEVLIDSKLPRTSVATGIVSTAKPAKVLVRAESADATLSAKKDPPTRVAMNAPQPTHPPNPQSEASCKKAASLFRFLYRRESPIPRFNSQ
jgi:hypothetical protein